MSNITTYLNKIKTAIYGKDVRQSIHDAIKEVYDDASVNRDNANMEVKLARGGYNTLNDRLSGNEEANYVNFTDIRSHIAQLTKNKLDADGTISVKQINKALGKIDETYISDELLQQMAGNAPIHSVPADGSITPQKNAYPTIIGKYSGENLFNANTVTNGRYVYYLDGVLWELDGYNSSDYIQITGGVKIESNFNEQTAFYDENKVFISGVTGIGNGGVVAPSNAKYIRVSVRDDQLTTCLITQEKLPVFNYTHEPRLSPKQLLGQCRLIPSQESKIKIINQKATLVNFTLFEYTHKFYLQLSGTYDLTGQGMLVLNPINGDVKVCNFHTSYLNYQENYIPLLIEQSGLYTSPILEQNQIINLDYDRTFVITQYKATGHYNVISEAIEDIKQINTNDEFILHIRSGAYDESLDLQGVNNISLIGEEMESTIIYNHNANYYKAPLTTNGGGTFENLTFMSTSELAETDVLTSYAMHYESDPEPTNLKDCIFRNCRFKSDNNSAVGIGMRSNETIIFDNCEFIKTSVQPYGSGAFYCHCSQFKGHKNQNIILKDCVVTSDNQYTFHIDDSNSIPGIGEGGNVGGEMVITFINVNAWCQRGNGDETIKLVGGEKLTPDSLVGSVVIHPRSFGNNVTLLNR